MKRIYLTIIALGASLALPSLHAQDEAGDGIGRKGPKGPGHRCHGMLREKLLERFDTDGDGKLDETERAAAREARQEFHKKVLEKFDTDGDGKLDEAEREAAREARRERCEGAGAPATDT